MPHPAISLRDSGGNNVSESLGPVSTRASCGPCHDYPFITSSLHFQQGRDEMSPVLLADQGLSYFHTSPGMFGKYAFFTNRQLTRREAKDPEDFDMGTPEWLMRCGGCHGGGGPAEKDMEGRPYKTVPAGVVSPLAPGYHTRDSETAEITRWDWRASGTAEGDCFLCHLPGVDFAARKAAMAKGEFAWAATAGLCGQGLAVKRPDGRYQYDASAFGPDGRVLPDRLPISPPRTENCGFCHGFTARDATTIPSMEMGEVMRCAEKAGWVYAGSLIRDTVSPRLAGRERFDFPWDVHAAAGLECADCHFSPNNPSRRPRADRAKGLNYRPGGEDHAVYLKRPDHNFARGKTPPVTVDLAHRQAMRGCADCHDTSKSHAFLPFRERHLRRLACQACHIPAIHFWAYRSQEWAVLLEDGGPRTSFRGILGSPSDPGATVTGFRPAFISDRSQDGMERLRPVNPISGVFWYDRRKRRPVFTWQLRRAFFDGREPGGAWRYRPECLGALDSDGDGHISRAEAVLDTAKKVEAMASLLRERSDIQSPELRCLVAPWAMSHSTVGGRQAVRECRECHAPDSVLRSSPPLADVLPPGTRVFYLTQELPVVRAVKGGTTFDNGPLLGESYILGYSRLPWVEAAGKSSLVLVTFGCLAHGLCRIFFRRRP